MLNTNQYKTNTTGRNNRNSIELNNITSKINNPTSTNKPLEAQVKSYEARARSFQALANSQSISPPYSSPEFRNHSGLNGQNLRMVYLQEANRYLKFADQARKELEAKKKLEE